MTLKQWLSRNKLTQFEFSRRSGLHQAQVCRLVGGKYSPGIKLRVLVERVTGGDVALGDWPAPVVKLPARASR